MAWQRINGRFVNREEDTHIEYRPADSEYDAYYYLIQTSTMKPLKGAVTMEELGVPAAAIGDNSGDTKPMIDTTTDEKPTNVAANRLRSIVERIERLEEERKALGSDIKDIFSEAKSAGFDVKVLRALLRLRGKDPAEIEEQETLLDVYRRALGM
jgi:uncharacterized protein (UPF0335 family)